MIGRWRKIWGKICRWLGGGLAVFYGYSPRAADGVMGSLAEVNSDGAVGMAAVAGGYSGAGMDLLSGLAWELVGHEYYGVGAQLSGLFSYFLDSVRLIAVDP